MASRKALFESWNLHDAVLKTVNINWELNVCEATLNAFLEPGQEAVACAIRWEGIFSIEIHHDSPWGASQHVNQQRLESENLYVLEMQSGDEIRIKSQSVRLDI